ncbi:aldolase [Streptomyces minutiscleroticus]|uniref:Aldolase n=1 Tax=Streptomyces minutiscleroticus TaxID=68238 RepID=A0A918NLI9_9ACTN|nr:class II aldolase/adducin family protein [Streptomyces minutiscleroticus]GGX78874.1 aldolase [Streptomyces minutiscleroticus]
MGDGRRGGAQGARDAHEAEAAAGEDLVAKARRTVRDGLVVGTSGNVSVRVGGTVPVTPTGVPYDRPGPSDVRGAGLPDGRRVPGRLRPTGELPLRLAVYRAADARAAVHAHAVHVAAVSALVPKLPPAHCVTAALGGPVRVAPCAAHGAGKLAENALRALAARTARPLRNHGTLAYGATLAQAYDRTAQPEWMCRLRLTASSVPGRSPALLSPEQPAEAAERLRDCGQPG